MEASAASCGLASFAQGFLNSLSVKHVDLNGATREPCYVSWSELCHSFAFAAICVFVGLKANCSHSC